MKRTIFIFLTFIFIAPAAFAFDTNGFMTVGYGSYNEKAGAEIALGIQLKPFSRLSLDIAPLTGIFRRKDDPRYVRERDDDNKRICKDKATGQNVDTKYCGINFKYAFESSLKVRPLNWLELGAGTRVADRTLFYGLALIRFTENFGIESKFGDDYVSALFRVDI